MEKSGTEAALKATEDELRKERETRIRLEARNIYLRTIAKAFGLPQD